MLALALQTLRGRRHSLAGTFVALVFAGVLVTACGVLMQTGLEGGARVDRYAAAPIVVAGDDEIASPVPDGSAQPLPEPSRVPATLAERVAAVDGVERVIADRSLPATLAGGGAVTAHGWSSAALAPYTLGAGRPPRTDAEVVLEAGTAAGRGVGVGDAVRMLSTDGTHAYTVTGVVRSPGGEQAADQPAVFVTDALAARLSADPRRVDALGVMIGDGAGVGAVAERIEALLAGKARVLTGDDRGTAASPEDVRRDRDLVALAGGFGGTALMLAVFVVAATLGLSVLQRSREIALLRTIGAKPRQVRTLLVGEAALLAVAAGLVAIVPGLLLGAGLFHALRARGVGAETTTLAIGLVPAAVALGAGLVTASLAAWLAGRRAARVRPTVALAEASLEPRRIGWIRLLLGIAFLAGGAALCATALSGQGQAAVEASGGTVLTLMVAVGLLGPLLARVAAALGGPLIGALSPTSGFLAKANLRTRGRRLSAAATPLALAIALVVADIGILTVEARATRDQSRERMVADRVLTAAQGLPDALLERAREVPGVATVTAVQPTEAGVVSHVLGGRELEFLPAAGVSPADIDKTLDLEVEDGSLAALRPGAVAVGSDRLRSMRARIGDRVAVWLADGHRIRPRVVATYASTLGLGDLVFPRESIAAHAANPMAAQAFLAYAAKANPKRVDTRVRALARTMPGVRLVSPVAIRAETDQQAEGDAWVTYLVISALMGFCAIAIVNTLAMSTWDRSRELALLRLVGATDRQVIRMIRWEALAVVGLGAIAGLAVATATLVPFSLAVAGSAVPYVPWYFVAGVLWFAALLGFAATELPARAALRANPADVISAPQ